MSSMRWLGQALRPLRPGMDKLAGAATGRTVAPRLDLRSEAFGEGEDIPARFTADGDGSFPGLSWSSLPDATRSVALLVEDADIPFVVPVTHLIVIDIDPSVSGIAAGAVPPVMRDPAPDGWRTGRNFLGAPGWTPPAPPPGHGAHRYAFQLFALDEAPAFRHRPSRRTLLRRIRPHIIAQGTLVGTYKRR